MKVSDILAELTDLQTKRDEINTVLTGASLGTPQAVLGKALDQYQKKVQTFMDAQFEPVSTIVYLAATVANANVNIGADVQITLTATFSDGTSRALTNSVEPLMFFRDYDNQGNNAGYMTSVDISGYKGVETTFTIIKTSVGFNVKDLEDTQGLVVVPTANPNEFQIEDINGVAIGIKFVTNSNVATKDNWLIDIYFGSTGTVYTAVDPTVATVNAEGLVSTVGGGTTDIIATNGTLSSTVSITVVDNVAPETPVIQSVNAIINGATINFEYSPDVDVSFYRVYVGGNLGMDNVTESPVNISLVADGITSYSITMTAVDTSGNESVQSTATVVSPLQDPGTV